MTKLVIYGRIIVHSIHNSNNYIDETARHPSLYILCDPVHEAATLKVRGQRRIDFDWCV